MNVKSSILNVTVSTIVLLLGIMACADSDEAEEAVRVQKSIISGTIEKGPFVQGSKVSLCELTTDLLQTGKNFVTQTFNDMGAFCFETPMSLNSQYVELEANGYFYNELKGKLSASQITLNALSDVRNRNSVNVNLITHLEYGRVKKLVQDGVRFSDAKRQAEKELLACFAIKNEIISPEAISITDNSKSSAVLLAISTIMLYEKSEAEFSEFIAKFSSDFADNGRIDNPIIRTTITQGQQNAHPKNVIDSMKAFYADRGVSIECDDYSGFIDFNGDGAIDENDKEWLDMDIVEESFWATEADLESAFMHCYLKCLQFETAQRYLEAIRTGDKTKVHSITPENVKLSNAFTSAYGAINIVNQLLVKVPLMQEKGSLTSINVDAMIAEVKCLRAFVYYNVAMLWGNVALVTKPVDDNRLDAPALSKQEDVYQFAYSDICDAVSDLPTAYANEIETKARFTRDAALMLKAEIELALGHHADAQSTLNSVSNTVFFGFAQELASNLPVYTSNHLSLYRKEASGITENLESEWAAMTTSSYGYWSALKRLGKAQEVTGCYDYELLMPFPSRELRINSKWAQNPGY
ncbi:MAG: RagB/SusD family nutrient uptake outer membrane protein [Bacteroidaceae bacterium]|nr:RagB/SusD family nutrient uptake outer membrane protein [Bacteroidaceae bacterium]